MFAIRVKPGQEIELDKVDPGEDGGLAKAAGLTKLAELGDELSELTELLFAASTHSLLVILQGRDTSGKDGSIRGILGRTNVQSTRVVPFKVPTPAEAAHDFLWRVHSHVPARGEIAIFNRSHYEDVLVVRVHDLVPEQVWKARYDHINHFEKLLTDSKVIVVKAYLHISAKEQDERLREREVDSNKAWKLNVGDWKEREFWDDYTHAYEAALRQCSPANAPWHILPADRKWYRDLALTEIIVEALRPFADDWREALGKMGTLRKAELTAYRKSGEPSIGKAS
jgi:PPK2 family polyphosphate:nucleotide phosphotransferase